jgi:hypothetical protein
MHGGKGGKGGEGDGRFGLFWYYAGSSLPLNLPGGQ